MLNVSINNKKQSQPFQLTHRNTWLLWCCQIINIGCLAEEISTWMLAILALCLCWQALFNIRKISPKNNSSNKVIIKDKTKIASILLTLFALSGCIAIAITATSLGILISMVHLLTFAYVLKAFEIKQRKDFYQVCLLGIFLLASALIFKQNLLFSVLIAFVLIVNLMVLLQAFSPKQTLSVSAKTIVVLLIQSSLFAIVLFVVFPRLTPFWQVPNAQSAKTGLSNEVSLGDIANLALSSDLAFRVDFNGKKIPQYDKLYWRAMTLENYDGIKWTRTNLHDNNEFTETQKLFTPVTSGEGLNYNIIVEPNHQSWLFGLSVITTDNSNVRLMDDYTVQSKSVLSQISHYELTSYLQTPLDLKISNRKKQRNLHIVNGSNPRLEQLAYELKQTYADPVDRSNAVLALFREQNYFYTLKPPLLVNNSLDQFFFDTKAGFCVYYASAYTYLMRAAGVPARIVTGYLGGEYNGTSALQETITEANPIEDDKRDNTKQGGHLSIYQYDAHAWSEIWLEGIGWQRVDPTAAVDPQRVESGWSTELLSQQSSLNNDFLGLYQYRKMAWLNAIRLQFDALDYQWTRWVLAYSSAQQYDLLKRWFGGNIQWKAIAIVLATLILIMVLLTLLYRVNVNLFKRKKLTTWSCLYQRVLKKLAKKGTKKPTNMSPSGFAKLVAQQHPELANQFKEFTITFETLMYRDLNNKQQTVYLSRLKQQYIRLKNM